MGTRLQKDPCVCCRRCFSIFFDEVLIEWSQGGFHPEWTPRRCLREKPCWSVARSGLGVGGERGPRPSDSTEQPRAARTKAKVTLSFKALRSFVNSVNIM